MVFNAEALAGKSKQAQMVKPFVVTETEVEIDVPCGLIWIPIKYEHKT